MNKFFPKGSNVSPSEAEEIWLEPDLFKKAIELHKCE